MTLFTTYRALFLAARHPDRCHRVADRTVRAGISRPRARSPHPHTHRFARRQPQLRRRRHRWRCPQRHATGVSAHARTARLCDTESVTLAVFGIHATRCGRSRDVRLACRRSCTGRPAARLIQPRATIRCVTQEDRRVDGPVACAQLLKLHVQPGCRRLGAGAPLTSFVVLWHSGRQSARLSAGVWRGRRGLFGVRFP